jgi:hypothetical protein
MSSIANKVDATDDRFWDRDVVAKMWDAATANDDDTSPIIDRQVDRTDGLMAAVMFGCVGAFAGAVANPDRWEVPAFALFALFVVLLFGKNVDF